MGINSEKDSKSAGPPYTESTSWPHTISYIPHDGSSDLNYIDVYLDGRNSRDNDIPEDELTFDWELLNQDENIIIM